MSEDKNRCASCGKLWECHEGIQHTCRQLQIAIKALEEIANAKVMRSTPYYELAKYRKDVAANALKEIS